MDLQLRFPLFEELLQGSLNPLLPAMAADTDYYDRIERQIVDSVPDEGRYAIYFREIHHVKQRYYKRLLMSETFAYCNELISILEEETSPNIRAYYRDAILDKHLTTCLKRLSEKLEASDLNHPLDKLIEQNADIDKICNSYVLQLLKVCLAKAYLEVQDCLADVVRYKLSEKELYSSLLNELPPIKTGLKLRPERQVKSLLKESPIVHTAPANVATPIEPIAPTSFISDEKFLSVKEIGEKTNWDERTIRRYLKDGKLKGSKPGGSWIIAQSDFDAFYNHYKNQQTTNEK
ncbi:MAG: helix-turn-helix domain-containing protein [Paludibacter sp.]|nr:helix-turn-helix domain-containing protein [Paludibacter sp.]